MNNWRESAQYAVLFSYLLVLLAGGVLINVYLLAVGSIMALLRLGFASHFWARTQAEPRIFWRSSSVI